MPEAPSRRPPILVAGLNLLAALLGWWAGEPFAAVNLSVATGLLW